MSIMVHGFFDLKTILIPVMLVNYILMSDYLNNHLTGDLASNHASRFQSFSYSSNIVDDDNSCTSPLTDEEVSRDDSVRVKSLKSFMYDYNSDV